MEQGGGVLTVVECGQVHSVVFSICGGKGLLDGFGGIGLLVVLVGGLGCLVLGLGLSGPLEVLTGPGPPLWGAGAL